MSVSTSSEKKLSLSCGLKASLVRATVIAPLSNQQSSTPNVRLYVSPSNSNFKSLTKSKCKSVNFFPVNSSSSLILPIHLCLPEGDVKIKIGVPQTRLREIHQSGADLIQFANLSVPTYLGYQLIFELFSKISGISFWTLINQASHARYTSGVSVRQQYWQLCVIFSDFSTVPDFLRAIVISKAVSITNVSLIFFPFISRSIVKRT